MNSKLSQLRTTSCSHPLLCQSNQDSVPLLANRLPSRIAVRDLSKLGRGCLLVALLLAIAGCGPKEREFIPPKEAESAIAVAKQYAATNGGMNARVWDAQMSDGMWIVYLEYSRGRSAAVKVSPDGKVVLYSGPR